MKSLTILILLACLCGCGKQEPFVLRAPSGTNEFSITISNASGEAKTVHIGAEDYGLDPGRYLVISNYAIDLHPHKAAPAPITIGTLPPGYMVAKDAAGRMAPFFNGATVESNGMIRTNEFQVLVACWAHWKIIGQSHRN